MLNVTPYLNDPPVTGEITRIQDVLSDKGKKLRRKVEQAEQAKFGLKARWDKNEAIYRDQPRATGIQLIKGREALHMPLVYPALRRIFESVHQGITSPTPMVQAISESGQPMAMDDLEKGFEVMSDRAGFSQMFKMLLERTGLNGAGIVRQVIGANGLQYDIVHPNDFVIAPVSYTEIRDASMVGHFFQMPLWKIKQRQKSGLYRADAKIVAGEGFDSRASGRNPAYDRTLSDLPGVSTGDGDQLINLYDLTWLDVDAEEPKRWRVTLARDSDEILAMEAFPYSRPCYFDCRFEKELTKWWPSTSTAQHLQGAQEMFTRVANLFEIGTFASALPPIILRGTGFGKEKVFELEPGKAYCVDGEFEAVPLPITFNASTIPMLLELIKTIVESVTGITSAGMTRQFNAQTTATEVDALQSIMAQNENAYAIAASNCIEDMFEHLHEMCLMHSGELHKIYGSALPEKFWEQLLIPCRWECLGKHPGNSPDVHLQKLKMLAEMSMQPQSRLDYNAIEALTVRTLRMPINVEDLTLEEGQPNAFQVTQQQQLQLQQAAQQPQLPAGGGVPAMEGGPSDAMVPGAVPGPSGDVPQFAPHG